MPDPDRVRDAFEANFEAHQRDCSGFVKAVATDLGVSIVGMANDIVDKTRARGTWQKLPDGIAANASAGASKFVVVGLYLRHIDFRCVSRS